MRTTSHIIAALVVTCAACGTTDPVDDPSVGESDPTLSTMDRIMNRSPSRRRPRPRPSGELQACLKQVDPLRQCPILHQGGREIAIRLALDPRYLAHWSNGPERLNQTLSCVNRLYQVTGISWSFQSITPWEPGANRNNLYALLDRLQAEFPPTGDSVLLGMVLWDERKIYKSSGGEIGLSQRAACVVPSWPRVENDCVILAHELGHLIGAKHVPGKSWLMGWAAAPFHLPSKDPLARVVASYRFHPRNIAAINAHRRARFTRRGLAIPRVCSQKLAAMDRCWGI